jgi:SPP1 family predicted phage head-tail adaptor
MPAGKYRHRIEIQEDKSTTKNDHGEIVPDWKTVARRWVRIVPLAGSKAQVARQINPKVTHNVEMRYWQPLHPEQRIKYGTRILEINSIINTEEKDREQHMICTEAV